jgi:hypothetical protein
MNTENRKTNVEMITDMMEFSNNGPLMQAFIIEAIYNYSSQVVKAGPEVFNNGLIDGNCWIACAEEAVKKINNR